MKIRVEVYEVKKTGYVEVEFNTDSDTPVSALNTVSANLKAGKLKTGKNNDVSHILIPIPLDDDEESKWVREIAMETMKVKHAVSGV